MITEKSTCTSNHEYPIRDPNAQNPAAALAASFKAATRRGSPRTRKRRTKSDGQPKKKQTHVEKN